MAPLQNNTPMTVKEKQDRRDRICIQMEAAMRPVCGDRPSTTVFKENKTAYGCHKRTEPADEDKDYVKVDEVKDYVKVDEDKDYVKVDENADFVEVDVDEMEMSDWEEI
ncbi:hypothetical protein HO133_000485 [Letharia lupina]|uniref:Uncharacterized protein n=1 Tax=Letharia lupina TaxID=560253 RepID=A0A8H6FCQ5_9LECA|nr:uncharacterized protein HO133_000485 [Letharia lupina]KAF6223642.1 hypothetical protein HO133_000485 [Letharia lupina]